MIDLTLSQILTLLTYDELTGHFTWKVKRQGRNGGVNPGDAAGSPMPQGHIVIGLAGKKVLAHRLVWFINYGRWPVLDIDHINGDGADNRLSNLREVTHTVNMQNRRAVSIGNKSTGVLGVSAHRKTGRFISYIHLDGKKKHLGVFSSVSAAHEAHVAARRKHYPGNTL